MLPETPIQMDSHGASSALVCFEPHGTAGGTSEYVALVMATSSLVGPSVNMLPKCQSSYMLAAGRARARAVGRMVERMVVGSRLADRLRGSQRMNEWVVGERKSD